VIESGVVHLPESAPWLADFLDEVINFPASKHSDQVDSMSQFLDWVRHRRHPAWPWMQAQPLNIRVSIGGAVAPTGGPNFGFAFVNNAKADPPMARLKVPPGPSHVETMWGRTILVPENRIIKVTEEEAVGLRLAGYVRVREDGADADAKQITAKKAERARQASKEEGRNRAADGNTKEPPTKFSAP